MSKGEPKLIGRVNVRGLDAANLMLSDPVLARSSFVRALGPEAEGVLQQGKVCRLRPDGVVFREGQPATSVVLVVAGELAVRGAGAAEDLMAGTVPAGELTGAEAVLGVASRMGTATAVGQAVVVEVPVCAFLGSVSEGSPLSDCLQEAMDRDMKAASEMEDFLDRW